MISLVGDCNTLVFNISPEQRLKRQLTTRSAGPDNHLVVHACTLLNDAALDWLLDNPGMLLCTAAGQPLAINVSSSEVELAEAAIAKRTDRFPTRNVDSLSDCFNRKLRRRTDALAINLVDTPAKRAEWLLFQDSYKGITDIVTSKLWPMPAFVACRFLSRVGALPNHVTLTGFLFMLIASWAFYEAAFGVGLVTAWAMTFLDTVDGKLARVTVTSSRIGDILDHGMDYLHPPIWWSCLAHGLALATPKLMVEIGGANMVILGCYVAGRAIEIGFKKRFGFNAYIWQPFDSRFRAIVARRNILLLILTAGLALGLLVKAFVMCALWSLVSTGIQAFRFLQANATRKRAAILSWLA